MHNRSSGAATPDAAALEAKIEESVALRALKAPTISSIRVTSSARPSSRANSLARFHNGPPDGRMLKVRQGAPTRRYCPASSGSTPARTRDDFPEPEAP